MSKVMRHSWCFPPELATKLATLIIEEYPRGLSDEELDEIWAGDDRKRLGIYSFSVAYAAEGRTEGYMQEYEAEVRALDNYNLDAIAEVYKKYFGYGPLIGGVIPVREGRKLWGVA